MMTSGSTEDVLITVKRDAQGQITQAYATTPDGVTHSFTVTRAISTNPSGYRFVEVQVDFYEGSILNEQKYLTLLEVYSPDAGKWSFQFLTGANSCGLCIGFSPTNGQGTIISTTAGTGTVDLTKFSLLSVSSPVSLTLSLGIQAALHKAAFFQGVFEQEGTSFQANLEAALQQVNLDINMPANTVLKTIYNTLSTMSTSVSSSAPTETSMTKDTTREDGGKWWKLAGDVYIKMTLMFLCSTVTLGTCIIATGIGMVVVAAWKEVVDSAERLQQIPNDPNNDGPTDKNIPDWGGVPDWGGSGDSSGSGSEGEGDGCFAQGTMVASTRGLLPIEQLKVGDQIYSYDLQSKSKVIKKIVKIVEVKRKKILVLNFGDEKIRCTPLHHFYTGQWTTASELKPGDKVLSLDGQWRQLKAVQQETQLQSVFNLILEGGHHYAAGLSGFIVHKN